MAIRRHWQAMTPVECHRMCDCETRLSTCRDQVDQLSTDLDNRQIIVDALTASIGSKDARIAELELELEECQHPANLEDPEPQHDPGPNEP